MSIDIGGEHVHVVAAPGESAAKAVHRDDGAAVARCRQIGRNDVQDTHCAQDAATATGAAAGADSATRSSSTPVANSAPAKNAVSSVSTGSEYACAETRN